MPKKLSVGVDGVHHSLPHPASTLAKQLDKPMDLLWLFPTPLARDVLGAPFDFPSF